MKNRLLIGGFILLVCQAQADGLGTSPAIGIVSFNNAEMQILTTKKTLSKENILICSYARKSCNAYQGSDFSSKKTNGALEDVAAGNKIYTYSFNSANHQELQSETILAFIFHDDEIKTDDIKFNGQRGLIINSRKIKDVLTYCTSSEGVHVVSRSGDVHLYYSLGYEVEANCPDEVYK